MPDPDQLMAATQTMAFVMLLTGVLLALLPIDQCGECHHCRNKRLGDAWCLQHGKRKRDCQDEHRP